MWNYLCNTLVFQVQRLVLKWGKHWISHIPVLTTPQRIIRSYKTTRAWWLSPCTLELLEGWRKLRKNKIEKQKSADKYIGKQKKKKLLYWKCIGGFVSSVFYCTIKIDRGRLILFSESHSGEEAGVLKIMSLLFFPLKFIEVTTVSKVT